MQQPQCPIQIDDRISHPITRTRHIIHAKSERLPCRKVQPQQRTKVKLNVQKIKKKRQAALKNRTQNYYACNRSMHITIDHRCPYYLAYSMMSTKAIPLRVRPVFIMNGSEWPLMCAAPKWDITRECVMQIVQIYSSAMELRWWDLDRSGRGWARIRSITVEVGFELTLKMIDDEVRMNILVREYGRSGNSAYNWFYSSLSSIFFFAFEPNRRSHTH